MTQRVARCLASPCLCRLAIVAGLHTWLYTFQSLYKQGQGLRLFRQSTLVTRPAGRQLPQTVSCHAVLTQRVALCLLCLGQILGDEPTAEAIMAGSVTPMFFGSAFNNFGVDLFLQVRPGLTEQHQKLHCDA